jgi:ribonuclease R
VVEARRSALVAVDATGQRWRIPAADGAAPGDRVALQPRDRRSAEVIGVLGRERAQWLGIVEKRGSAVGLVPYRDSADWRILIDRASAEGVESGAVALVELAHRGRRRPALARGRILRVLGRPGDPEVDFAAVAWRHELPTAFAAEAEAEAAGFDPELSRADRCLRRDLRELPFVTIDPESARDFDDAVYAEPAGPRGTRLWVAVADVSHFVRPGTALDREALSRGTSVYFPERALPMLPERLSGDLCSLRPGIDRSALVVELEFDARARLAGWRFHAALIRSASRLSYAQAAAALAGQFPLERSVAESLARLDALTQQLREARLAQGSLELELPERAIEVDASGRAVAIRARAGNAAHRLIEEAMLAANRAVAAELVRAGSPGPFRNHAPPAPQAGAELRRLLASLDLVGEGEELTPLRLAAALRAVRGRPEGALVHRTALRSLPQARYEAESRGHFALAFDHYLHFTSPIRRYADLVVHRALKDRLGIRGAAPVSRDGDQARRIAARLSWRERVAEAAERERGLLHACAFLAPRVGEVFEARVAGIAAHGLYVTPDDCFVEGLVHIRRLPGCWDFDERGHRLVERRRRLRYALGDALSVRLAAVDPMRGRIDFALAE